MRRRRHLVPLALALLVPAVANAQSGFAIHTDLTFFGDNTEFKNAFREGETRLGVEGRLFLDAGLSERVALRLGVFGNQRFGAEHGVDDVKPVITLVVRGRENQFLFGALDVATGRDGSGPDRDGPHALLPPLQDDRLAFVRGAEAGLQWLRQTPREQHDAWINWQQLNTPGQREAFDAGAHARALLVPRTVSVWAALHAHIVHHGGQLFSDGAVSDSGVVAPGVLISSRAAWLDSWSAELYALRSLYRPDREVAARTTSGIAAFGRFAAERAGWRGHLIVWRGCDFIKEEGDPNYQSIRRDGTRVRATRDYAEVGVTRTYRLDAHASFQVSARLHRIEDHYEYSYRLLARLSRDLWRLP
jgi:hypothetical protein